MSKSYGSGLVTRRLDALAREIRVDSCTVDAQHASDADSVEAAVVNQPTDRLGVNTELAGNLANADQTGRITSSRRHNPHEVCQVVRPPQSPGALRFVRG